MDEEDQRISPVKLEWNHREQTELLRKLDSYDGNGIGARDFQILFKRCKRCMRVGARPAMNLHIRFCSGPSGRMHSKYDSRIAKLRKRVVYY
jgi:hypothetical protein